MGGLGIAVGYFVSRLFPECTVKTSAKEPDPESVPPVPSGVVLKHAHAITVITDAILKKNAERDTESKPSIFTFKECNHSAGLCGKDNLQTWFNIGVVIRSSSDPELDGEKTKEIWLRLRLVTDLSDQASPVVDFDEYRATSSWEKEAVDAIERYVRVAFALGIAAKSDK